MEKETGNCECVYLVDPADGSQCVLDLGVQRRALDADSDLLNDQRRAWLEEKLLEKGRKHVIKETAKARFLIRMNSKEGL